MRNKYLNKVKITLEWKFLIQYLSKFLIHIYVFFAFQQAPNFIKFFSRRTAFKPNDDRMTFKTYEERRQAAEKMCEEGKGFQQLFQRAPFNKRVCSY